MTLEELKKQLTFPLRIATLVFLSQDNQILLAMKKRGFGMGLWNGVGGKVEKNETVEAAAKREAEEEIGVTITSLQEVATLDFFFLEAPVDKDWNQQVRVFFATAWTGEPNETEEMKPQWFDKTDLPFDIMWPDDPYWLPAVLKGYKVSAEFAFGPNNSVEQFRIEAVKK